VKSDVETDENKKPAPAATASTTCKMRWSMSREA
jgi:hypothetical protein